VKHASITERVPAGEPTHITLSPAFYKALLSSMVVYEMRGLVNETGAEMRWLATCPDLAGNQAPQRLRYNSSQIIERRYLTAQERAQLAWAEWTQEDREHELAATHELSDPSSMDEQAAALKLLGSFAQFVQREAPHLALELGQLAVEWAKAKNISQDQLLAALTAPEE
jgi:hypothetical protein